MTDRYTAWQALLAARDLATAQLALIAVACVCGWFTVTHIQPRRAACIGLAAVVIFYVSLALLASGNLSRWLGA